MEIITGQALRLLRNMKGIKQQTMAAHLGISQPAYCKMENSYCVEGKKANLILHLLQATPEEIAFALKQVKVDTKKNPAF